MSERYAWGTAPLAELVARDPRAYVIGQQLRVDAWTAEAARAMHERGLRPILLKGPATIALLYRDDPDRRPYNDADLFVAPTENTAAREVLVSLGYSPVGVLLKVDEIHARMFERPHDGAKVDLHRTLHGFEDVDPERVWDVMSVATEPLTVAGEVVQVPSDHLRLLNVALHLLPTDDERSQAWRDLDRALAFCSYDEWRASIDLAIGLGISDELSPRVRRHPAGRDLAHVLGLPAGTSARYRMMEALHAATVDESVLSAAHLAALTTWRERTRYVAIKLLPPRSYLESRWPLASRSRVHLVAARITRVAACIVGLPRAWWQWRRSRRIWPLS